MRVVLEYWMGVVMGTMDEGCIGYCIVMLYYWVVLES